MLTEPWRITLFGRLQVEGVGRVVPKFRTSKTGALLAYLALHTMRPATREELAEEFWPDYDLEKGLASLRRILVLADVDGGSVVWAEGQQVALRQGTFVTDVARFETSLREAGEHDDLAVRKALLEKALALYTGELLPGFYDDWVLQARERLRQRSVGARHQLVQAQAQTSDLEGAIQNALLVVSAEPLEEAHHLALMRLFLAAGQPEQARRQYRMLERGLREELKEAPSAQALYLLRDISASEKQSSAVSSASLAVSVSPMPVNAVTPASIFFPPVSVSSPSLPPRLPAPLTPIVGREAEIAQVVVLLKPESAPRFAFSTPGTEAFSAPRLVTLIGPGGMGKTRLALAVAQELAEMYCHAVWWVNLAGLDDAQRIPETIRDALRLDRSPSVEPLAQVTAHLRDRPTVLVLDNFEPLLPAGSHWARTLLEQVPELRLLVTSRRVLNLEGEYSVPVPPLLPDDSTRLFVARAQAVRSDFTLTSRNAANVEDLCARLDGIPFALELAAARIGVRTPAEMLTEPLLDVLVSRRVDIAARHQKMRAVIASTVSALSPDLQSLFTRLSVFHGGWTSEAAAFVCSTAESETTEDMEGTESAERREKTNQAKADKRAVTAVRDRLETLREFALIRMEENGETMRGRMLDTLREFGAEQLSSEEAQKLAERHATYFLNLAEASDPYLHGMARNEWLDRLESEHNNLRAALDWLCMQGKAQEAMRLATSLAWFWRMRGYIGEGRQHLVRALALSDALTRARARALRLLGLLVGYQDDPIQSTRLFVESLELAQRLNDSSAIAWALYSLAHNSLSPGAYADAHRYLEESSAIFENIADRRGLASALHKMGSLHMAQNASQQAYSYFERAMNMAHEVGDTYQEAVSQLNMGTALVNMGDGAEAMHHFHRAAALFTLLGDTATLAVVQISLGGMAYRAGHYEEAKSLLEGALITHRQHKTQIQEAIALYHLGSLALRQNQYDRARELWRDSLNLFCAFSAKQRIAILLGAFGWLALAENTPERAARLFGASATLFAHIGTTHEPREQSDYAQAEEAVRAVLGNERFTTLWEEGGTWNKAAAVSYALHGFLPSTKTS